MSTPPTNIQVCGSTEDLGSIISQNYGSGQAVIFSSFVQYLYSLVPNFGNCVIGDPTGKYTWTLVGPGPIQFVPQPPNPSPYAPPVVPHTTVLNVTTISAMMQNPLWIPDFDNLTISMLDLTVYKFSKGGVRTQ